MPDGESLVFEPRDYANIIKLTEPGILEQFLDRPAIEIVETIMGAFQLGKSGLIASGKNLALGLLKGRMYKQFAEEFKRLRDAGKLPEDFADQKNGFYTWAELMAIIDDECPDADRLEALKAMFYAVNKATAADWERIQAYQLWNLTKQLGSGELYLLKVIKENINQIPNNGGYQAWARYLSEKTGFMAQSLVDLHEKRLTELFLLTPRQYGDRSGISTQNGRLTDLGLRLCSNIETYHVDLETAQ
ncbi:MAG TPA: hypothetical protein VMF56_05555 [Acidobacteriaceae bacterium]|nr:hypothetical protein [Acidobacteriaceae bacterium]